MLADSVVVARDGARADVRALADFGVADVAEMVLLDARLEAAGLDLGEVAEPGLAADGGTGAQVREGSDLDFVLDLGPLQDAGPDVAVPADDRVDDLAAGADPGALADLRAAPQDDARIQDDVLGQLDGDVHVRPGRVHERHAGQHVAGVDGQPQLHLGRGQLGPVVDAGQGAVVFDFEGDDRPAVIVGELDQLGEIELARDLGALDVTDPATQPGGVEGVDAGVDLLDPQLVGRGVLVLHDPKHLATVLAADDASQAFWRDAMDRHEGHGRVAGAPDVYQLGQQV